MEQRNNGYMVCYGSGELQSAVLQYIIMLEKTRMALAETLPYALTLTDFFRHIVALLHYTCWCGTVRNFPFLPVFQAKTQLTVHMKTVTLSVETALGGSHLACHILLPSGPVSQRETEMKLSVHWVAYLRQFGRNIQNIWERRLFSHVTISNSDLRKNFHFW